VDRTCCELINKKCLYDSNPSIFICKHHKQDAALPDLFSTYKYSSFSVPPLKIFFLCGLQQYSTQRWLKVSLQQPLISCLGVVICFSYGFCQLAFLASLLTVPLVKSHASMISVRYICQIDESHMLVKLLNCLFYECSCKVTSSVFELMYAYVLRSISDGFGSQ
jgi:hypothetical protein